MCASSCKSERIRFPQNVYFSFSLYVTASVFSHFSASDYSFSLFHVLLPYAHLYTTYCQSIRCLRPSSLVCASSLHVLVTAKNLVLSFLIQNMFENRQKLVSASQIKYPQSFSEDRRDCLISDEHWHRLGVELAISRTPVALTTTALNRCYSPRRS